MEDALIMDTQPNDVIPSKEAIATFPPFQNIAPENIVVINSIQQCEALREELEQIAVFGLDTESKPTFKVGEVSTGPHLVQLATLEKAYLFQECCHLGFSETDFCQSRPDQSRYWPEK